MMGRMFALFLLVGAAVSERAHFYGDKVLSITPHNEEQANVLRDMRKYVKLDFWTQMIRPGAATDVHVLEADVKAVEDGLKKAGLTYKIIIQDLDMEVAKEDRLVDRQKFAFAATTEYDYENYNKLRDIHKELRRLAEKHPEKVSTFSVGKSYQGRDMLGVKISTGLTKKPAVWVNGCLHAREWISCASVMYLLKMLVDPEPRFFFKVDHALSRYDFYILPVFNVDGYEFTKYQRMWRKTRSGSFPCRGTDPNRNWDSHWADEGGASKNPCDQDYRGTRPNSEIEVKQVSDKLIEIHMEQGLVSFWDVHAYSDLMLYPWGYKKGKAADNAEMVRIAEIYVKGIKESSGREVISGPPGALLYPVTGVSLDWAYDKLGVIYSFATELRPQYGEIANGFLIAPEFIRPSGLEFTNGFLDACIAMK